MNWQTGTLALVGVATLTAVGLAAQQFIRVKLPDFPVTPKLICMPLQEARGQARWDGPSTNGYLYGNGSLLLQQCMVGTWVLRVKATPMNGEAPRLLVNRAGEQLLDQDMNGTRTLRFQVSAGQALVLTAPNTRVVLEDRNLYVRDFRFIPNTPCLQNPAALSSSKVGNSRYGEFDLLSNGSVTLTACGQGTASFRLEGSETAGVGPDVRVKVGDKTEFAGVIQATRPENLKVTLSEGQTLDIAFLNDATRQTDQRLVQVESALFKK